MPIHAHTFSYKILHFPSCGSGWSQMEHTWMRFASSSTREQSLASACDAQARVPAQSSARPAALSSDYLRESSRTMQNLRERGLSDETCCDNLWYIYILICHITIITYYHIIRSDFPKQLTGEAARRSWRKTDGEGEKPREIWRDAYCMIWNHMRTLQTCKNRSRHRSTWFGSCRLQLQDSLAKQQNGIRFFPHSETQWIIGEREQRGQGGKGRVSMGCPFVLVFFSFVLVDPRCQHLYTLTGDVRVSRGGPQISPLLRFFSRWFPSKSHGNQRYQNNTKHSHLDDRCTDQIFGLNELQ